MYCIECGKQNLNNNRYCKYCGIEFENVENIEEVDNSIPQSKTAVASINSNFPPFPYVISISKLIILTIATFGIYEVYWFYKHWKSFKAEVKLSGTPLFSAIFSPITSYSLFKAISNSVKTIDKNSDLHPGWMAFLYFIFICLYRLPGQYWWLSMLSVLPLIHVQNNINFYWVEKYKNKVSTSGFTGWNWLCAIVGGIILISVSYGSSESNSTSSSPTATNLKTEISPTVKVTEYNQEDIISSVVNIYCASTEKGEEATGGSGTILSESGVILTNSHVIPQDKDYIHVSDQGCLVVLPDSKSGQPKEMYWAHPFVIPKLSDKYDLAYLTIYKAYYDKEEDKLWGSYPKKFPAFSDTTHCTNENIKLGESVRIFGYPAISGGYSLTITDGIVSSFPGNGEIVTSAKISYGNSGGLAVDRNGCMLGVPTLVSSDENESLGIIYSSSLVNEFSSEVSKYLDKK